MLERLFLRFLANPHTNGEVHHHLPLTSIDTPFHHTQGVDGTGIDTHVICYHPSYGLV